MPEPLQNPGKSASTPPPVSRGKIFLRRLASSVALWTIVLMAIFARTKVVSDYCFLLIMFVLAGAGLALSAPTLFRTAGRLGAGPAISTVAVLGYVGFTVGPPLIGGVTAVSGLRGGLGFLAAASALLLATAPILRRLGAESER